MLNFLKLTLVASVGLVACSAFAKFDNCNQFFVKGTAPSIASAPGLLRELCFDNFAVLHSGQTKTPVFVAERLNAALVHQAHKTRTDVFYEEARLPSAERAQLTDYAGSGFDRGHQSPAADQPTDEAMAQSFSLSNMVPQAPTNNRVTWAGIEKATRKYVSRAAGDVYLITGPVYTKQFCSYVEEAKIALAQKGQPTTGSTSDLMKAAVANGIATPRTYNLDTCSIGAGQVQVPQYLYKLVYDATTNRAWAHWVPNTNEAQASQPISYSELVKRTGINFFPGLTPKD